MSELSTKVGTYCAPYDATDAAELKLAEAIETRDQLAPEAEAFVSATRQAFKAALGRRVAGASCLRRSMGGGAGADKLRRRPEPAGCSSAEPARPWTALAPKTGAC
jgi:hypothetical protein